MLMLKVEKFEVKNRGCVFFFFASQQGNQMLIVANSIVHILDDAEFVYSICFLNCAWIFDFFRLFSGGVLVEFFLALENSNRVECADRKSVV